MNKIFTIISLFLLISAKIFAQNNLNYTQKKTVVVVPMSVEQSIKNLYKTIDTNGYDKPDFYLFEKSIKEFVNLNLDKKIITIIDYNQDITNKRLWVIDLKNKVILYNTEVGHGKNSGKEVPVSFSNKTGTYMSSIGRFITAETYQSKKVGYALRIDGIDKDGPFRNDFVRDRGIVFHASARKEGVWYSLGCPSLPRIYYREIIDIIKEGTFVYMYHNIFTTQNLN